MSILVANDFRTESLHEVCRQLDLTDEEAGDAHLTDAIGRLQLRLEEWTNDRYESQALTLDLDGSGWTRLYLPRRCTELDAVSLRDEFGDLTLQDPQHYRFRSSLYNAGRERIDPEATDYLVTVPGGGGLSTGLYDWPTGPQSVRVVGNFGWVEAPTDIKRALALCIFDHFKPLRADLRRTVTWRTTDASMDASTTTPSGIPEADAIIASYHYDAPAVQVA